MSEMRRFIESLDYSFYKKRFFQLMDEIMVTASTDRLKAIADCRILRSRVQRHQCVGQAAITQKFLLAEINALIGML